MLLQALPSIADSSGGVGKYIGGLLLVVAEALLVILVLLLDLSMLLDEHAVVSLLALTQGARLT